MFAQDGGVLSDRAREVLKEGDYRSARLMAERAIVTDLTDPWAYIVKSDVELKLKLYDEAVASLEACHLKFPEFSSAYDRYGTYLMSINEP